MGKRGRARSDSGELELSASPPAQYVRGPFGSKRRKRKPFGKRQRLGHETPGSVLRGPPITVDCECGEKANLRYGDRWSCPSCGLTYDTAKIPRDQYEKIRNTQLRYRALPVAIGVVTLSLAIFFTLTGNIFAVFVLLPSAGVAWFMLLRPAHRRRYMRALGERPKWNLRAEARPSSRP